jgi:AbrB family looped-hinge helix DNA binding protein
MRITTKGQVTIPQDLREALGLLPHTEVVFSIERGAAVIRPKAGDAHPGRADCRPPEGPRREDAHEQPRAAGAAPGRAR